MSTLFGASPYGALPALDAPAPEVVRLFLAPGKLVDDWAKLPAAARTFPGVPLVLSWKDDDPAKARALLESAPPGAVAAACHYHEPEDNFTTATEQAAFRARQERHAAAVRAAGVPYAPIFMAWSLQEQSGRGGIAQWWAGPDHTDVLGWDVYNGMAAKGSYADPAELVGRVADFSEAHGLPFAVGETASPVAPGTTAADRTAWATALRAEYARRGAVWACWWDQELGGVDYRLDADTARVWLTAPPAPEAPPVDPSYVAQLEDELASARRDLADAVAERDRLAGDLSLQGGQLAASLDAEARLRARVEAVRSAVRELFGVDAL